MTAEFGEKAKGLNEALHGMTMAKFSHFQIYVWPEIIELYEAAGRVVMADEGCVRLDLALKALDFRTKELEE